MSEMRRINVLLMGEDVGVFGGDFGTSVGMLEEFGLGCVYVAVHSSAISGATLGSYDRAASNAYDLMDFS